MQGNYSAITTEPIVNAPVRVFSQLLSKVLSSRFVISREDAYRYQQVTFEENTRTGAFTIGTVVGLNSYDAIEILYLRYP